MVNLKEKLLQEKKRLEYILKKTEKQLKDAPEGSLRLSNTRKWTQYYYYLPGEREKEHYISKDNEDLIRKLAQKGYDAKVIKLARKRLDQIKKITKDYDEDEIEKLFLNEHGGRRKWIHPVEPTWNQQVQIWLSKEYIGKQFREGEPMILTDRGERVRSKSEKIIADCFFRKGIPYKYECPLYLKGLGVIYPDFTILSKKTRQEIYWEHHGRMDDPTYAQMTVKKIQAYEENEIFPGERLILTFETQNMVLNSKSIEQLADRYL